MRIIGKIIRWLLVAVGLIQIIGNLLTLGDAFNKGASLAVIGFWLVVVVIIIQWERMSSGDKKSDAIMERIEKRATERKK